MNQQSAGRLANQIHFLRDTGQIGIFESIRKLDALEQFLSETQLRKFEDLVYESRHNRHMYDDKGFYS